MQTFMTMERIATLRSAIGRKPMSYDEMSSLLGISKETLERVDTLLSALRKKALTYDAMATLVGVNKQTVVRWIKQLKEMDSVFISDYAPDSRGRLFMPMFKVKTSVEQVDAARPGPRWTAAERMARSRERAKKGTRVPLPAVPDQA